MADLKLSDLIGATTVTDTTFFYGIDNGISKKYSANVILENLNNPILKGRVNLAWGHL